MIKLIIFLGALLLTNINAQNTNIYNEIIERNAFDLTEEKITKILPPVADILRGEVFLTGIHSLNRVKRVSLVIREKGSDKFISLTNLQANSGIQIKSIGSTNVLASVYGTYKLLSFKNNSLPTKLVAPTKNIPKNKEDDKRREEILEKMKKYSFRNKK